VTALDLRGVPCPLNWVRARLTLEMMREGEALELLLDDGEPIQSVPRSAADDGHDVTVDGSVVVITKRC
jgi:tRNA 2-thiouridine synthesizing protein A